MAKIFGWEFFKKKEPVVIQQILPLADKTPEITRAEPSRPAISKVAPVSSPVLHFLSNGTTRSRRTNRDRFFPPEYDLVEIGRVEDVEAYCRQAFQKKTALMFKEGFDYSGPNPRTIRYLQARLAQIAFASGIPHDELLRRIGSYLIRRSNAFLIKVRDREASGGQVRKDKKGREIEPVAGYFPAPPEMMEAEVDNFGKVVKWRQRTPTGVIKDYAPEDVIHFTFDRKEGFIFGTPTLVPVLDDIRALRRIEQDIELLVYHHLFPIFQYIVGTEEHPAGLTETGEREIDVVKKEIQLMPNEGGIVTPERHKIELLGSESRALRAEPYLDHFKRRVLAGLGISAVDVGEGDTSNKSTSDNMSLALIDGVKDFQAVLESQLNHHIIEELLLESTFGDDVLSDENMVRLKFREVDLDKQIKIETHSADQFSKHAITWDELRTVQGRQPIRSPQFEDDPEAPEFTQWRNTFWKLFHEPELMIRAIDEKFSPISQAASDSPNTAIPAEAAGQAKKNEEEQRAHEIKVAKARKPPARPKKDAFRVTDNFLSSPFHALEEAAISELTQPTASRNVENLRAKGRLIAARMQRDLETRMYTAFISGLRTAPIDNYFLSITSNTRQAVSRRASTLVDRLVNTAISKASRRNTSATIQEVFDALRYRTGFISDVEVRKALNWGRAIRHKLQGAESIRYLTSGHSTCQTCLQAANDAIRLDSISLDDIVPHHASCECRIIVVPQTANKNQDSVQEANIEDVAKLESCVLRVKQQLRRKNPGMSEKTIKGKAFAICQASLNK